jgi:hypothetical protein
VAVAGTRSVLSTESWADGNRDQPGRSKDWPRPSHPSHPAMDTLRR